MLLFPLLVPVGVDRGRGGVVTAVSVLRVFRYGRLVDVEKFGGRDFTVYLHHCNFARWGVHGFCKDKINIKLYVSLAISPLKLHF